MLVFVGVLVLLALLHLLELLHVPQYLLIRSIVTLHAWFVLAAFAFMLLRCAKESIGFPEFIRPKVEGHVLDL